MKEGNTSKEEKLMFYEYRQGEKDGKKRQGDEIKERETEIKAKKNENQCKRMFPTRREGKREGKSEGNQLK